MFTGLIEDVGTVRDMARTGAAARLTIITSLDVSTIGIGDSVSVNGVCLTAVKKEGSAVTYDVSPETLSCSTLQKLSPGMYVNLERALRVGDRLGGHIVSGHVDCIGQLSERREISGNIVLSFLVSEESSRYLVPKGSVAIDGISLTVNSVTATSFSVNIIPHTGTRTTLHNKKPGDEVNIETDVLAKYVERLLGAGRDTQRGVSMELLAKSGFL